MNNFVQLGVVSDILGGYAFSSNEMHSRPGEYQLIKMTNLYQGTLDLNRSPSYWENIDSKTEKFLLLQDDILITLTGTVGKRDFGFTVIINDEKNLLLNQRVCRIRSNCSKVVPYYLFQYLKTKYFLDQFFDCSIGGTGNQTNVSLVDLREFDILLPPLPEQKSIADLLSTWDAAIEKTERLIAAKERRFDGYIQKMVDSGTHLWEHKKTNEIFSEFSKKNCPNEELLSVTQDRGVIPRSMLEGRVMSPDGTLDTYKLVHKGDFVISLRSFQGGLEYSGYTGILSPAYTVLSPKIKIDPEFYRHFFKSNIFVQKYLAVSVIGIRDGKQISVPDFMITKLPCPPLNEQIRISSTLNIMRKEIDLLKQVLTKTKQQKNGLMQKLLTGTWRVKTMAKAYS